MPLPAPCTSHQGYDVSFLLTNFNLEAMWKHKLIDFVVQFMEEIDSEISQMKIQVNERARTVGYQFLKDVRATTFAPLAMCFLSPCSCSLRSCCLCAVHKLRPGDPRRPLRHLRAHGHLSAPEDAAPLNERANAQWLRGWRQTRDRAEARRALGSLQSFSGGAGVRRYERAPPGGRRVGSRDHVVSRAHVCDVCPSAFFLIS